ncbi:MAG: ribose 5-phosphate isomerase B [Chloroflexota bacterium]
MRIVLGCDHRGLVLKQAVMRLLGEMGHEFEDLGSFNTVSVDYPDIAVKVGHTVASAQADYGVLVCSSGVGMSIAANKVKGVRAALCGDMLSARRARLHNDANVLCLGQDIVGEGLAMEIVKTFLTTGFEGGRHARRLDKVREIEAKFLDRS